MWNLNKFEIECKTSFSMSYRSVSWQNNNKARLRFFPLSPKKFNFNFKFFSLFHSLLNTHSHTEIHFHFTQTLISKSKPFSLSSLSPISIFYGWRMQFIAAIDFDRPICFKGSFFSTLVLLLFCKIEFFCWVLIFFFFFCGLGYEWEEG